jgi:hypothetical protein
VREKEALADLTVRQPFGGELRDLQLLGGEAVTGVRRAAADRLARRSQLMSSTFAPLSSAESVEQVDALAQRRTRISRAPLSPQPPSEGEQRPRLQEWVSGQVLTERGSEECLRLMVAGQYRSRAEQFGTQKWRFTPRRDALELGDHVNQFVGLPAANSCFDQVQQS